MVIELSVLDVVEEAKRWSKKSNYKRFIRIKTEKNFDYSKEKHPIERYLFDAGVGNYYFGGGFSEENDDYSIDLTEIKLVYPF